MELHGVDIAVWCNLLALAILDTSVHDVVATVDEGKCVPGTGLWYCSFLGNCCPR